MKTSRRNKLLGLALVSSVSLFSANNVLAAAGDNIANRATLSFSVGGTAQTDIGSSPTGNTSGAGTDTTFVEDRMVNFTVVRGGATTQVAPNATLQAVEYTLTNTGNGDQGFLLKGLNNPNGTADPFGGNNDIFDTTSVQTFIENGATPGFQPAEDTVAFVGTLIPTGTQIVYVVSTIPATQDGTIPLATGDVAVMSLVAQVAITGSTGIAADAITNDDNGNVSPGGTGFTNGTATVTAGAANDIADDPTTEETVFNDAAGTQDGTGTPAPDAIKNGQHSDDSSYTVQTAELTVTKTSAALYDPVNIASNPKSIPGGYVTYSISVANAVGAADAALTTLVDVLPATLDLDPDFVTSAGPGNPTSGPGASIQVVKGGTTVYCTAAADADGCDYTGGAGGTVTVDLSNATFAGIMPLAAAETVTVNFNTIVQ